MDFKIIENYIQENVKAYKEQFQKDSQAASTALKLEIGNIRAIINNMLDSSLATLDNKINEKEETLYLSFENDIKKIKEDVKELTVKFEQLESNFNDKLNILEKEIRKQIENHLLSYKHKESKKGLF
jgi:hypothetical protein